MKSRRPDQAIVQPPYDAPAMGQDPLLCQRRPAVESPHVDERRLLRGELDRAERRQFLRCLLKGCPECTALARWIWRMGELPEKGRAAR